MNLLLIGSGIITAIPLIWFTERAKRVPLSTIGFIQYLTPTLILLLGVFIFKEPFTLTHTLSFGFIWFALVLYSFSKTDFMNNRQPKSFKHGKCSNN